MKQLVVLVFASVLFWPIDAPDSPDVAPLDAFVAECTASPAPATPDLVCIYAEDPDTGDPILAFHLIRGNGSDLPHASDAAQLWNHAWTNGVIGILKHDGTGGNAFYALHGKVVIWAIYDDGSKEAYGINGQDWYRASRYWTHFTPWFDGGRAQSGESLVHDYYEVGPPNHGKMVLQTCIGGREGVSFVVAYRLKEQP